MGGHGNMNHDQQQGGHFQGDNKNEMQLGIHTEGGENYMLPNRGNSGHHKHTEVTYWSYEGHDHHVESGGRLVDSHIHTPIRDHKDHDMKHTIDSTSNIGLGKLINGGHSLILSGVHEEEMGDDYNHLLQGYGHISNGGYGEVTGDEQSHTNNGLNHILSGGYGGITGDVHTNINNGYDHALIGGYGAVTGGDYSHINNGHDHVLSGDYGRVKGGDHSNINNGYDHVIRGDYGRVKGGDHSHINIGHNNVLSGDYGGGIGGGHSHTKYIDGHDSSASFGGVTDTGHKNVKHVDLHNGNGYKVHEKFSEYQAFTYQTHGLDDQKSKKLLHVIGSKTAKDHSGESVKLSDTHDLDGKQYKHLHRDESFVVRNSYGDVIQDFWKGSHNSKEKDHTSFGHSIEHNHIY
jgi:hypothetical protein